MLHAHIRRGIFSICACSKTALTYIGTIRHIHDSLPSLANIQLLSASFTVQCPRTLFHSFLHMKLDTEAMVLL